MEGFTSIMHLPDDCLAYIFRSLNNSIDCQSFGLTCRRWLQIQNLNRRSLQFQCSFTIYDPPSVSTNTICVKAFHLHRLLSRFQHLESLSLCGCTDIMDSALSCVRTYGSKLRNLHLDCCFNVTDYGISLIASGCPLLTVISLYRCLNITDNALEILASGCLSLKHVNLSYCSTISDKGLKALTQKCRQLQAVRISNCDGIAGVGFEGCSETLAYVEADSCKLTPDGIKGIVSGGGLQYLNISSLIWSPLGDPTAGIRFSSNLKLLDFRMCRFVCDASIIEITKGCPLLEEWNLAVCQEVKLTGWQAIGSNCQNLKRLHVNRCRNFCDLGLQSIQNGCKSLSILYMNGCMRVSTLAIEIFKCHRAHVLIEEVEIMSINPNWEYRFNL